MGLDIDKLRKKLAETQERMSGGGKGDFKFWQPKSGRNVIRILPPKPGSDDFYAEARVRYNVGPKKRMVTVPMDDTEPCPIKEFVDALYETGDKDDEKLAKRMRATTRYYFNIIDRSLEEGDEGYGEVMVYGCGAKVFSDVLGIIVDPDYGDITDPENGYDIIITKSGTGLDTEYKVNARPKQTAIGIDDWEEKLVDLSIFSKVKSYEDREAILNGEEPSKDDGDEEDEEKPKHKPKNNKKPKREPEPEDEDDMDYDEDDEDYDEDDMDDVEAEIQSVLKRRRNKK